MFWLSATHNFVVKAMYVPGKSHILADTISRLHEHGKLVEFEDPMNDIYCNNHCIFNLFMC